MAKKKAAKGAAGINSDGRDVDANYVPRLSAQYCNEVLAKMQKEFAIGNVMAVPRLDKINLNIGLGEATRNIKLLDDAQVELTAIAGQHACITRAKRSIAAFKLREGMPIGCRVTLRGGRMWDFLDRLILSALPRVRDFRGVPNRSFDGRGNYTLGIKDHLIFPEVDSSNHDRSKGMNITIVTTSPNDERAHFLLKELGIPFAEQGAP